MKIIKDLWRAVSLILLTSFVLLLSDLGQRRGGAMKSPEEFPQIAVMQISSTTLLDAHLAGVISKLIEEGYYDDRGLSPLRKPIIATDDSQLIAFKGVHELTSFGSQII